MSILILILIAANLYLYQLLYNMLQKPTYFEFKESETLKLGDVRKKDCSKCKWKLKQECQVIEGICKNAKEYNNDKKNCVKNGYRFEPSGIISKLDSERCSDIYANACFDDNDAICTMEMCTESTWVPDGCKPYKEVGICLGDYKNNNNPIDCKGEYILNGIVKA